MPAPKGATNGRPYDITIVGAGMAYSAWQLLPPTAPDYVKRGPKRHGQ